DFPTKAMLIVTHNIEEAVYLADRIFVLSSNPGRIRTEMTNHIPRPRDRRGPVFEEMVDEIYGIMTGREEGVSGARMVEEAAAAGSPTELPLPAVGVGGLAGLLEILNAMGGKADLPAL